MRILWNEIKKIWSWKILLLLFVVNIVLFFLVIKFHITYFPNGRPGLDSYRISVDMVMKYGADMDEAELADFKKTYQAQVQEADRYLQSRKEFAEAGIRSYEDFLNIDRNNEKQAALRSKVMIEEKVDTFWELQERKRLIGFHDRKEAVFDAYKNHTDAKQQAHLEQSIKGGHYQVYSEVVMANFKDFIIPVAIAILISVVLVVSPVFIKDRAGKILELQYAAKKGRELYKTKAAAGLISTFVVITVLLTVYFVLYARNHTSMFFKVPVHAMIGEFAWYDPTFLQYIALTVIAIYLLGFVFALLAMAFSSIMPNYISLIGIQMFVFGMMMYGLSYLLTNIISLWMPQWVVPTSYSVMAVVAVIFIMLMWKREKKRDILMS
ncbi:hypothetical protein NLX71_14515 [Paenibacillus sp. MZ04-78.2]|uniref:hypothetical protein n=1 Tax=Paenibacillus sp. MZ04-78.2 TaxID=2962034 RepID=UPI0020B75F7B|nr:hypothetical protein [Paenibacillus sp. MZ04-78.2]MCP3774511.1 hypothetical protein [Paenibacillus sp. MZ04-78.2]